MNATVGVPLTKITVGQFIDTNPLATVSDYAVSVNWGDGQFSGGRSCLFLHSVSSWAGRALSSPSRRRIPTRLPEHSRSPRSSLIPAGREIDEHRHRPRTRRCNRSQPPHFCRRGPAVHRHGRLFHRPQPEGHGEPVHCDDQLGQWRFHGRHRHVRRLRCFRRHGSRSGFGQGLQRVPRGKGLTTSRLSWAAGSQFTAFTTATVADAP